MSDMPLAERIKALKDSISFHTPGHSGGVVDFFPFDAPLGETDWTETAATDNLLKPEGVIGLSEKATAAAYGTESALYSTAGATALVFSAVYANRSERFLIYGEAHKSVYNAVAVSGAEAWQTTRPDLKKALGESGASVVWITSPDYFGKTLDLNQIKRTADEKGVSVIVDASHGAHFAFSSILPDSATEYFDTVIHSLHKTMPVLTGGAVMHVKSEHREKYMEAFRTFHTTSPSYPVMLSIEAAVALFKKEGEKLYRKVKERIDEFRLGISGTAYSVAETADPTRLVISAEGFGAELCEKLEDEGIYAECCFDDGVALIVTPFNAHKLTKVVAALKRIEYRPTPTQSFPACDGATFKLVAEGKKEKVSLSDALGRRMYAGAGVYPPGTLKLFPGQTIGERELEILVKLAEMPSERVFGLENDGINVIK